MRVNECMTRDVKIAGPNDTIRQAATMMAECDAGSLPVGDNDRLVGMITDRDITVRAVAQGKGPDTPVSEAMSGDIRYCFEDDDCDAVLQDMGKLQVRRLPVLSREKRLIGIVSLGALATREGRKDLGAALKDISRPGGLHSQAAP